ncbi:hypothetical protein H4219_006315 [Mycoemilia scoparia]|uniref:Uncharacterized protein n=1 Tax=Mycoemilia scoparia TaxID=417184 RepID=A0A9W8DHV5_9FUNG|nr:hypothetical protein H4219_006315 [Mycoemilia scoparia]
MTPGSTELWTKYQKTPSRVGVQNTLTGPRDTLALPAPLSRQQGQNTNQVVRRIKKEEPSEESEEPEENEIPIDEWEQDLGDDKDTISIKKIAIYGMAKADNLWVIPITISTEGQSQEMNTELDTGAVMTCMAESAAKELKCTIIPKTGQIEFGINNLLKERIGTTTVQMTIGKLQISASVEILPGEINPPILIGQDIINKHGLPQLATALLRQLDIPSEPSKEEQ